MINVVSPPFSNAHGCRHPQTTDEIFGLNLKGEVSMKSKLSLLCAVLFVAAVPFGALAMNDHGSHGQAMQKMESGHAEMIMLGTAVEDGVKAEAHLNDVREAMAKAGMKETHHFMLLFKEAETGAAIEAGSVALKIMGPHGAEIGPIKLMGMEGHFGADIVLAEMGEYRFTVGTRLADGKNRQFEFEHQLN
jgi:hypothetical protein